LADAANSFLNELRTGSAAVTAESLPRVKVTTDDEVDDHEEELNVLLRELLDAGYAAPQMDVEVNNRRTVGRWQWPKPSGRKAFSLVKVCQSS
jgi:hypothetical protein